MDPLDRDQGRRTDSLVRWRALLCAAGCLVALPARASFLHGDTLDAVADWLALFIIFVIPIVGVVAFWMVHVLPEKVAHKRHHPQRDAIQVLCLLSLVFGGLLWPIAWLWAYSKPVLHKMAYGTDKHDDYYEELAAEGEGENQSLRADVAQLRGNVERLVKQGSTPKELEAIRDQLAALEPRLAAHAAAAPEKETH
jgi:CBS domain containing-hemolysin-like protein